MVGTLTGTVVSTRPSSTDLRVSDERYEELLEIELYERYRSDRERVLIPMFALIAAGAATVGLIVGFFLGRNESPSTIATVGSAPTAAAVDPQPLGAPESEQIVVENNEVTDAAEPAPATTVPAAPATLVEASTTVEVPLPEPLATFAGRRPWVGSVTVADDVPAIAVIEVGDGISMVRSLGAGGDEIDRFVDQQGPTSGIYVINFGSEPMRHLHIETGSDYSMTVLPLDAARKALIGDVTGFGDDVVGVFGAGETVQFSAISGGSLTVWVVADGAVTAAATASSGATISLPQGDLVLEVRTDDAWSLT